MKKRKDNDSNVQPVADEQFRLMIESVQEYAVFMLDTKGYIRTWNLGAERIKCYKSEEIIGQHFSIFYLEEERTQNKPERELEIAEHTGKYEEEGWRLRKNGTRFWANVLITALRNNQGNLLGFSKVTRDLTERSEAEQKLRLMAESAPSAMIMVNSKGEIVLVNSQTEKLFGYRKEELIGKLIEVLVPSRYRPNHPGYREGYFQEPTVRPMGAGRDLFALRKDGTEVPVEIALNSIETKDGKLVLSSIVDITGRRRLEEKFRLAVEAAPNAMIMVNREGVIILVNAESEKLFKYKREELIGQSMELLVPQGFRGNHPSHRRGFFADPQSRPMGAGRDLFGLRKDGIEVPVEIGLNPVVTEDGLVVLAAVVDITERKESEKRLEERRNELEKVNLELDRFVYTASHDLRAPLRGIEAFASFLEEDYTEKLDDRGKEYIEEIRKGVIRMSTLIEDLLTLSRITRIDNPYEDVDMNKLVRDVLERLQPDLSAKELELIIQPDLPVVYCDRIKMTEVFVNVFSNALKFSAKQEKPRVEFRYEDEPADHKFCLHDNGIGIDPRYHNQIFHLFKRLHTQEQYEGTGAGLNIVKRIVEEHGGKIWVDSALGKGTIIYLTIPKTLKMASQSAQPAGVQE